MAANLPKDHNIEFIRPGLTLCDVIEKKIEEHVKKGSEEAFYVCDLGDVVQKYQHWCTLFPRIKPFYAVKCNDSLPLLKFLAMIGTGFDCASKVEIDTILSLGVSSNKIVYAHTCKQANYIRYAKSVGVDLMTFDNENELHKTKALFPDSRLVLRILPPITEKVTCLLGNKFGCPVNEAKQLLEVAKELGLNVVGVSFHVGSGCYDAETFRWAVEDSRLVFDMGINLGFDMKILDVGGGFPGPWTAGKITLHEIAAEMNPGLEELFPSSTGVEIISEPGRYFVSSAYTLTVNVIAKKHAYEATHAEPKPSFLYYINDGLYGSFNGILTEKDSEYHPVIPSSCHRDTMSYTSTIWGPTCDGQDKILEDIQLPELQEGDWVCFNEMGAYCLTAGSTFNGIPKPCIYHIAQVNLLGTTDEGISAEDKFELHLKSGHTVCQTIEPLSGGSSVKVCSVSV